MDNDQAVNTTSSAATGETTASVVTTNEDAEARIASLEAEKNRLTEEAANWKVAALKYKGKTKPEADEEDNDDDRIRQITRQTLAESRIVQIAQEQNEIINKVLRENKELKLAHLNKTASTPPVAVGTHSESQPIRDTLVTPEQLADFKNRNWSDKDVERYKKNYLRNGGR